MSGPQFMWAIQARDGFLCSFRPSRDTAIAAFVSAGVQPWRWWQKRGVKAVAVSVSVREEFDAPPRPEGDASGGRE